MARSHGTGRRIQPEVPVLRGRVTVGRPERGTAARGPAPRSSGDLALDQLADLTASLLGAGAAQVSLLSDVQTIAGASGLPAGVVGSRSPLEDSLCAVTVASGGPLLVTDAVTDDRVSMLPPVTSGAVGSYLGTPLLDGDGHAVGALCVFDERPRSWSEADTELLQRLAAAVGTALELSAVTLEQRTARMKWELAIDAAGVGTFDWDVTTGALTWDRRLLELFGYDEGTFGRTMESLFDRVHPDDRSVVTQAVQEAVDSCGDYQGEYRLVLPDGTLRWVGARGKAVGEGAGTTTRLLGAAYDITSHLEDEAGVIRVLESMSAAFYSLDRAWRFTYVNAEAERLLGGRREDLLGGVIWELFPATLGSEFERRYRGVAETGEPVTFDAYYPAPLNGWYELRVWPGPDGLAVYFLEVTAQRSAQEQADRAATRAALLAEIAAELTGTLDAEEAVPRLAQLVVPALADWCVVSLVEGGEQAGRETLRDVGWWHVEPVRRPLVERYARLRLEALTDSSFVAQALRTGRPVVVAEGATARVGELLVPGEARDLLGELAPESAVILPLRGRGRTVGMLSLFRDARREPLGEEDLATTREVAGRAGLALDNARLYAQQRHLAEELQRSLLTAPPEPDHIQIVVRYEPAAEAAQVGGDWYDAFLQREGATVLVIGDVIGHDTAAAAAMGQVRGLLRGIAVHSGEGPASVLHGVDQVMETLQIDTTATVVVVRLHQTPEERERGVTRMCWSNAGHPPPIVINADASTAVLAPVDADLLLGIDPDSQRTESEVTPDRGATVLLYTDGLVERRGQSLDRGIALLRDTLAELAREQVSLDELCDAVLDRLLPSQPEDDVALVAVRLHRQDRPRPALAGRRRVPPLRD